MSNKEVITNLFIEKLGVTSDDLALDATNHQLGIDSLDRVEIVMELEKEFNIYVSDDEMDSLKEFGDYLNIVEGKVK